MEDKSKELSSPHDIARDNLIVEISYEFMEDIPEFVADEYDIPVQDTADDLSIEDFKFPIESAEDFYNQILEKKKNK